MSPATGSGAATRSSASRRRSCGRADGQPGHGCRTLHAALIARAERGLVPMRCLQGRQTRSCSGNRAVQRFARLGCRTGFGLPRLISGDLACGIEQGSRAHRLLLRLSRRQAREAQTETDGQAEARLSESVHGGTDKAVVVIDGGHVSMARLRLDVLHEALYSPAYHFVSLHVGKRRQPLGSPRLRAMNSPAPSQRILVVDDDPELRAMLRDYLTGNGFVVDLAAHGDAMRACLVQQMPHAVILDLMLPGEDGLALARELRRSSDLPILMLSARGEEIDRVIGLEVGADDYLPKPFSPRELLARLRALLRRAQPTSAGDLPPASKPAEQAVRFGPFLLDAAAFRLLRDGQDVGLSVAEFTLLQAMVAHPNRVLSRDQLIDWLKGYERDAFDRSIDVRVARLRRKIEDDPAHPVYVRTIRGQGYLFNPSGVGA